MGVSVGTTRQIIASREFFHGDVNRITVLGFREYLTGHSFGRGFSSFIGRHVTRRVEFKIRVYRIFGFSDVYAFTGILVGGYDHAFRLTDKIGVCQKFIPCDAGN